MNPFWVRASRKKVLETIFNVLSVELGLEIQRKSKEIARFAALKGNRDGLDRFQKNSGLTLDVCSRILSEVTRDKMSIERRIDDERDAIYGERALGVLFNEKGKSKWDKNAGCSPTDIIIVHSCDIMVLMGDCKFGLKSENSLIFHDSEEFTQGFGKKFLSVGRFLKEYDNVDISAYMLLIVTSSLAPLLINRFEDFKLDERFADIPYDKIVVCSVEDIIAKVSTYTV